MATGDFIQSHDTALCLVPPESCWPTVNKLRALYDKAHGRWPPHVNVVYPFVAAERLAAAAERISGVLAADATAGTMDISLDTAGVFSHRGGKTLFLHDGRGADGCAERLRALRASILAALHGGGPESEEEPFRMHMTVAQSGVSVEEDDATGGTRVLRKVEQLPAVAWRADRLHILVREKRRMRLWGVVHLDDGRLERLARPEPFGEDDDDDISKVAALVVPVEPVRATGPLADAAALEAALVGLGAVPSADEAAQRRAAVEHLCSLLADGLVVETTDGIIRQLVAVPVGSFALGVDTPASGLDCLAIGSFPPPVFFALALQRLRAAVPGPDRPQIRIMGRLRTLTGTMLELAVGGFRVDLRYVQAARVAETWPALLMDPHPGFDSLSPPTLALLKAPRDVGYLRTAFPDVDDDDGRLCSATHFRTAHRTIQTWARARGLYAARLGYLGGIHISVLLGRVMKLTAARSHISASVPDILATFFRHYAAFDWAARMAFDPFFHRAGLRYAPLARDPLVILGFHPPQLSTAHEASLSSVRVLARALQQAADHFEHNDATNWTAFLAGDVAPSVTAGLPPGPAAFVRAYRAYVKIDLQYWSLSLRHGAAFVGWLEWRCARLLADLSRRLPSLQARIWPGRFVEADADEADGQYQGCYLVGLDGPAGLAKDALHAALAHFARQIRSDTGHYDPQHMWFGVDVVTRADLGDVDRLRLDDRPWGEHGGDEEEEEEEEGEDQRQECSPKTRKAETPRQTAAPPQPTPPLRSAQDVIQRLRWDPQLDRSDYLVGYEDRFLGVRERALEAWKSEQTHDDFIPQHRIVYFKRRSDGAVVWDRRTRQDCIFGSGATQL